MNLQHNAYFLSLDILLMNKRLVHAILLLICNLVLYNGWLMDDGGKNS